MQLHIRIYHVFYVQSKSLFSHGWSYYTVIRPIQTYVNQFVWTILCLNHCDPCVNWTLIHSWFNRLGEKCRSISVGRNIVYEEWNSWDLSNHCYTKRGPLSKGMLICPGVLVKKNIKKAAYLTLFENVLQNFNIIPQPKKFQIIIRTNFWISITTTSRKHIRKKETITLVMLSIVCYTCTLVY